MEFVVPSTIRSKSTCPILPALLICIKCLIIIACHMFQDTLLYNINFLILENYLSLDRSCLLFTCFLTKECTSEGGGLGKKEKLIVPNSSSKNRFCLQRVPIMQLHFYLCGSIQQEIIREYTEENCISAILRSL